MKKLSGKFLLVILLALSAIPLLWISCSKDLDVTNKQNSGDQKAGTAVTFYLTNKDGSAKFAQQSSLNWTTTSNSNPSITVNTGTTYQTIDGFGFCLTEGSAQVINGLSSSTQSALLNDLFSTSGIGISVVRISIGASDLSSSDYSYQDGGASGGSGVPIGSTITLKGYNNLYVSSNNGSSPMTCDRTSAQGWEQFKVVDAGGGLIALQGSNGMYVSSENGASTGMNCNRTSIGDWEKFTWVSIGTNQLQLRGNNNQYVCQYANSNGTGPVACNRATASGWETFTYTGGTGGGGGTFSLAGPDLTYLIPILKKILAINSGIKILATPWSAPTWMKTNNNWVGGSLNSAYYSAYATYFKNYLDAMQAQGITIWAITPQNEPENPYNNPSMTMTKEEETTFINSYLGPTIRNAGYSTKIICFDHNCDDTTYPTYVCNNSSYVDGAAFHLYAGSISALSTVKNATGKNVYFTEQYTATNGSFSGDFPWHMQNVMIGAVNNWAKASLEWNLATNTSFGPYTSGGCTVCLGGITINSSTSYTKNVSYYIVAHMSKFVRPNAVRVNTSTTDASLVNVAFTSGSNKVLVVLNTSSSSKTFKIIHSGSWVNVTLASGSAGTFVWQ